MIAVEQLEGKARDRYGGSRLGVPFYNLQMRRYSVVIYDILQRSPIGNLFGGNGPFPCLLKSFGHGFANFAHGVAGPVVGNGSMNSLGSRAGAKPCVGLILGRSETVDIGGQRANNLLRAVANDLKDNARRRLLDTRFIIVAMVFEL